MRRGEKVTVHWEDAWYDSNSNVAKKLNEQTPLEATDTGTLVRNDDEMVAVYKPNKNKNTHFIPRKLVTSIERREHGGSTRPQQQYLVDEAGEELYDPNPAGPPYFKMGQPGGPDVFTPPADGNIIPHDEAINVVGRGSTAGAANSGVKGLLRRQHGGPVKGNTRTRRPGLIPRQEGGPVSGNPWFDYQKSINPKLADHTYDPIKQIMTGPGGSVSYTPMRGPQYSDAIVPTGNVSTGGATTAQAKLEATNPEYIKFLADRNIPIADHFAIPERISAPNAAELGQPGGTPGGVQPPTPPPVPPVAPQPTPPATLPPATLPNRAIAPQLPPAPVFGSQVATMTLGGTDAARDASIEQWGWVKGADGTWTHPETGATGHWTSGGQFVNATANKILDPRTGEMQDFAPAGSTLPPNPYAGMGQDIPTSNTPTGQPFGDWNYDNAQGVWWNSKMGTVYNPKTDQISDPNDPDRLPWSRYEPSEGEFMQPWQGQFGFDPADAGFQSFNRPFEFDPGREGFQPFNQQFEFDAEDLYRDPSYPFRLSEGAKIVERSGAARGMLKSGRTLKELTRYAQDYASTEYGRAYSRAEGEFERNYGQSRDAYIRSQQEFGLSHQQAVEAYNRELDDYVRRYNIFEQQQAKRFNRISGIGGGGQTAPGSTP
ncbi:MAG TPA: hypothetical protein ENH84_04385 [Phycisphaerae bacterium]|nr:hypothetical protein [Phycisphaerae bacterium]